ncbi:MAG: hypothetical protein ACRERC_09195 [Candidatus Binatia bacterium]
MSPANRAIVAAGGSGSATIALLQPIIYLGGPSVYRFFGAPPYIAEMRGVEPLRMALWSTFWFLLFLTFAVYAFSAARLVPRVPLLRPVLVAIAVIYAIRGLAIVPQLAWLGVFAVTRGRDVAFSALAILLAIAYAIAARHARRSAAARETCSRRGDA